MSESSFIISPPDPPNATALAVRTALAWVGWTTVYLLAGGVVLLVLLDITSASSSPSPGAVLLFGALIVMTLLAYVIGRIFPHKSWIFGPIAAGLVPVALAILLGIGAADSSEYGPAFAQLGAIIVLIFFVPSIIAAIGGGFGVMAGERKRAATAAAAAGAPAQADVLVAPGTPSLVESGDATAAPPALPPRRAFPKPLTDDAYVERLLDTPMPHTPGVRVVRPDCNAARARSQRHPQHDRLPTPSCFQSSPRPSARSGLARASTW